MIYKASNGWTRDSIIKHIKENFKGKSVVENTDAGVGRYRYRGPEERKCAIGLFIPDKVYNVNMENIMVVELLNRKPKLLDFMPIRDVEALELFQKAHDRVDKDLCLNNLLNWIKDNVY